MSEQSGEAVNGGQAIYDALSDEAKAAVDVLSRAQLSDQFFVLLTQSIEVANEVNPNGWGLLAGEWQDGRWRFLNLVSNDMVVFGATPDHVYLSIRDESGATVDTISQTGGDFKRTERIDACWELKIPLASWSEFPDQAWSAHLDLLRWLGAKGWARTALSHSHRDDWRVKLGLIAGVAVRPPAYVPFERFGLPMKRKPHTVPLPPANGNFAMLNAGFAESGLEYTAPQVSSFYTSLQTKGFVILSGISGTGKSKIAQRFADLLPKVAVTAGLTANSRDTRFRSRLQPYMQKYNRFAVPMRQQGQIPTPPAGVTWESEFVVNGRSGVGRITTEDGTNNRNTWVFFRGESAAAFRDVNDDYFFVDFIPDESSGVARVAIESSSYAQHHTNGIEESAENYLFLPVRPDWRDGKALIGYHNPLSGEYVRTPFLDFVLAAADDYTAGNRNAFFVILDEMNLAHVEYCFADVLSVIESGRDDEGWTVEGIPIAVREDDADLPQTLRLPPNLYIVGTVNMDETTPPFSPKVLDRAFTIELTEVDFTNYPAAAPVDAGLGDDEKQALLDAFTGSGTRYPRIDKDEIAEFVANNPRYRDDLQSLNASLRRSRMHFGYRVFDEIMQFAANAERNGMYDSVADAFDHAVLMKVLPKFNGSRGKLQNALYELIHWCHVDGVMGADDRSTLEAAFTRLMEEGRPFDQVVKTGEDSVEDNWRYPATGARAALMMQDLYTDGFASFG